MRKEIIGILLFFLLVFILVSLVSYHPQDPSFNNATSGNAIENLFGLVGAYLSDALIGLFGLGAFWVPLLLLFLSIQFFAGRPPIDFGLTILGGLFLVLTSGALLAFQQADYLIFGNRFSSGGWIGVWGAFACEVGKEEKPIAAGRYAGGWFNQRPKVGLRG